MLKRSATDIRLAVGECVWAFKITDGQDTMIRYIANRSRTHVVDQVSAYLQSHHPTWRIIRVDKLSQSRVQL